ncbi:dihydrolipoamide acyltransferase, partial [Thermus scotoductus]
MAEPKITPLARRLAEENGIDWRRLQGTGPEGTIVERDILAFLAKVMAGEVDLPPMPE